MVSSFSTSCYMKEIIRLHSPWLHYGKFNSLANYIILHSTKKPVTTMLTYPWKCTVLHCNHLGNKWKPLVLMTQHFDYHVVSRCFPGGFNVKLYISRGRLAWWLLAFLHSAMAWSLEWYGLKFALLVLLFACNSSSLTPFWNSWNMPFRFRFLSKI